jgi:predicted transcriptional regulator
VSGEFADFVTYDPQAFIILTDLYDTHYNEDWKNSFKNTGVDILKNPNLTMLGASSPIHFKECLPTASITGGFIGRTLLIYEDKRSRINPLVDRPEVEFNPEELVGYLRELKNVKGEFSWTDSGKRVFKEWYQELRENEDKRREDDTGTEQRLNDHVLKVAMLLQLAEDKDNLIITAENVRAAVELLTDVARSSKRNLIVDGKSASKDHVAAVLRTLMTRPGEPYTREAILSQNWGHINIMEFDVAIEGLKQMSFVEEYASGGQQYYKLTPKGVAIFFAQAKGRIQ